VLLKDDFIEFELVYVSREQNSRADLLAKLASSEKGNRKRSVIQETLNAPRTMGEGPPKEVLVIGVKEEKATDR